MTAPTIMTVSRAQDVLGIIPMQMGFQPANSVVLISLRGDRRRIGLLTRLDMPGPERALDAAVLLAEHLAKDSASAAILAIYTDHLDENVRLLKDAIDAALTVHSIELLDGWHVGPDIFTSLTCQDTCCTPQSVDTLMDGEARATFTMAGVAPARSREEAMGWLPEVDDTIREKVQDGVDAYLQSPSLPRQALECWQMLLRNGRMDTTGTAVILAHMSAHKIVRDAVMATLIPDTGTAPEDMVNDPENALISAMVFAPVFGPVDPVTPNQDLTDAGVRGLQHLAAHATGVHAAPPLALLGWLMWWNGNGAKGLHYSEMALKADPTHRLAQLIMGALEQSKAPGWAQKRVADDITAE